MSTLVCFHAHPDDEAMGTGGLMAQAAAAGHRVVLVTATDGAEGEPKPGVLDPGEALADRRRVEVAQSAKILGAELVLLGFQDSGMMGESANENPDCFWQADLETAARRLSEILTDLEADVLTVYDDHGLYGHPDHIKVHQVGVRAAEIASTPHVYMGTVNRDRARAGFEAMREQVGPDANLPDASMFDEFGLPADDIAFEVDVSEFLHLKRQALEQHRSQVSPDDFFLAMAPEMFSEMFGREHYAIPGQTGTGGPVEVNTLPGL